jgi:hypothetical protein
MGGLSISREEGRIKKEGFRDVHIGNAQAWYYSEDSIIVLWERFLHSFLRDLPFRKDTNMMLLWTGFEQWLLIDIQRQKESRHRELSLWERGRG